MASAVFGSSDLSSRFLYSKNNVSRIDSCNADPVWSPVGAHPCVCPILPVDEDKLLLPWQFEIARRRLLESAL
jgi:hypothetical protein